MRKKRREIFYLGDDPVTKFIRLKAYANPQYLVTEFKAKLSSQEEKLWDFDPLRKALAIARFTELLSKYEMQYSEEYIEIMKVNNKLTRPAFNNVKPKDWYFVLD